MSLFWTVFLQTLQPHSPKLGCFLLFRHWSGSRAPFSGVLALLQTLGIVGTSAALLSAWVKGGVEGRTEPQTALGWLSSTQGRWGTE